MKLANFFVLSLSLALGSNFSLGADGWSTTGKINAVQPEMYRKGDVEGGYPIFLETNISSTDCGGSTWAIRSNWDDGGRMYANALTAFASNSDVKLYQSSCYTVGGKNYPRVGGFKITK